MGLRSQPRSRTIGPSVLLPDVNVFVYAFRADVPHHIEYRTFLQDRLAGDEPVGVSEAVLSSVVRITTNHRIFVEPSSLRRALDFCDAVLAAPAAIPVRAGSRHWALFTGLCVDGGASGNLVPDAYLAALSLEQGATLVTSDRGLHRWPGVTIVHPLDGDIPTRGGRTA